MSRSNLNTNAAVFIPNACKINLKFEIIKPSYVLSEHFMKEVLINDIIVLRHALLHTSDKKEGWTKNDIAVIINARLKLLENYKTIDLLV